MKRIALLMCGMLLLAANTAEANWTTRPTYAQPARVAPAAYNRPVQYGTVPATYNTRTVQYVQTTPAAYAVRTTNYVPTATAAYSTSTAQGVANIMASSNRVGHWGGNPGYEGCGSGATPAAAYNNCCYANSGMTTVDVGYARGANGMWFCCRRYR